jgi:hypothetical protein
MTRISRSFSPGWGRGGRTWRRTGGRRRPTSTGGGCVGSKRLRPTRLDRGRLLGHLRRIHRKFPPESPARSPYSHARQAQQVADTQQRAEKSAAELDRPEVGGHGYADHGAHTLHRGRAKLVAPEPEGGSPGGSSRSRCVLRRLQRPRSRSFDGAPPRHDDVGVPRLQDRVRGQHGQGGILAGHAVRLPGRGSRASASSAAL